MPYALYFEIFILFQPPFICSVKSVHSVTSHISINWKIRRAVNMISAEKTRCHLKFKATLSSNDDDLYLLLVKSTPSMFTFLKKLIYIWVKAIFLYLCNIFFYTFAIYFSQFGKDFSHLVEYICLFFQRIFAISSRFACSVFLAEAKIHSLEKSVLRITLNCICWRGTISGDLSCV